MENVEYANAYSEVLEILKYISEEEYNKIPIDKISFFKANANKNYKFKYDFSLTLNEQNVSKRAKAIIAILFRDYWATIEQREKILAKQKYDREQIEDTLREKYNPDNIFSKKNEENKECEYTQEVGLIVLQEEKWYKKIFNIIKKFLLKT